MALQAIPGSWVTGGGSFISWGAQLLSDFIKNNHILIYLGPGMLTQTSCIFSHLVYVDTQPICVLITSYYVNMYGQVHMNLIYDGPWYRTLKPARFRKLRFATMPLGLLRWRGFDGWADLFHERSWRNGVSWQPDPSRLGKGAQSGGKLEDSSQHLPVRLKGAAIYHPNGWNHRQGSQPCWVITTSFQEVKILWTAYQGGPVSWLCSVFLFPLFLCECHLQYNWPVPMGHANCIILQCCSDMSTAFGRFGVTLSDTNPKNQAPSALDHRSCCMPKLLPSKH